MKYGFKCYPIEVNGKHLWFAESMDLEFCAGQGDTMEEAIKELEENEFSYLSLGETDNG